MPWRIFLRQTDFFKEIQRYLTTMHGNQVPVIELSFIDNFSWKKLSLNLIREVAGLEQEEYMYENCRDNKYFLINLDTEVRNNDSITKIWLCKVMSEKRGWQVTKSPPLNPPLDATFLTKNKFFSFLVKTWCCLLNNIQSALNLNKLKVQAAVRDGMLSKFLYVNLNFLYQLLNFFCWIVFWRDFN